MKRFFNKRQRKTLQLIAGSICQICGNPFESSFHADHKKPFSKGGKTIFRNGQALCESCNLVKGNKDVTD